MFVFLKSSDRIHIRIENFGIGPADDPVARFTAEIFKLAVAHDVAELIPDILDKDEAGQIVDDVFKKIQVVTVEQFVSPHVRDILNDSEEVPLSRFLVQIPLNTHFKIPFLFSRSRGVDDIQNRDFVIFQLLPCPVEFRQILRRNPFLGGDGSSVAQRPETVRSFHGHIGYSAVAPAEVNEVCNF